MANGDLVVTEGVANRALPASTGDGGVTTVRLSRYGEQIVKTVTGTKLAALADEGTYFTATNATLGTAITGTAAPTAFSATVALFSLFNSAATGGKKIYLDWLMLEVRAAGTNGTNFLVAQTVDRVNRYSSGGTAVTPVNPNADSDTTSLATLNVGALTAAAASASSRRVHHTQVRSVIKVIGDKYLFRFGDSTGVPLGMVMEGTAQAFIPVHCPPVVLGPSCTWLLHEIAASQSVAATYEFSMGWWER